jgi:homocysteine S-methyltransferase
MKKVFLLDGGMGQELVHRSKAKPDNLWSARVLMDEYDLVVDLHKDFIKAGACAITLNSYAITPYRLEKNNFEHMFTTLQQKAISAAKQAIKQIETDLTVKIIGSLPPLVASYQKTIGLDKNVALESYKKIVDIQENHVDVFLCETVCSIEEALISTEVALQTQKPVWLSFSVDEDDGTLLRSGEKLSVALKEFDNSKVDAILVNCSSIESIQQSVDIMKSYSKPFGALANGFETIKPLTPGNDVSVLKKRDDFNETKFVDSVVLNINNGASIVGGCCEVSPKYISAVHKKIINLNYTITNEVIDYA